MTTPREPLWRRYLRFLRPNVAGDIDDELRFHLSERVEELVAQGVSADEAARQAIAEFGDVEGVRQRLRSIDTQRQERRRRADRWQVIQQELGHAWRRVVRAPGFAVPAVATLALGLAATTTVYALLDAVVLRPLPFPHGERLVSLSSPMPKINDVWGIARHQMFYYLQNAHTMESMALYRSYDASVAQEGDGQPAERVAMANVSASIFEVLGIRAHLGRTLTPDDNLPRTANAVMLGYEFWSRRFGADPSVVGRTIQVDGYPVRVVGVAARGATLPDQRIDVWFPDHIDPAMPAINNHARSAVARLRPGYTASDLEHELAPLVLRMEEVFPQAYPDHWIVNSGFRTAVVPLRDEVVGATVTRALWIVLAAVGIVLLIAVANVVNLCIVRADARRREVAVRRALGAGQWQLAVHHAAEATVITAVAGLLAAGLSAGALRVFHWVAPDGLPRAAEVTFGWRGAGVVFVAAVFVAALLSAVTAAHARRDLSALRDGGRALTASRARLSLRGSLVGGQLALALVLLACAALMFRSFETLRRVRTGFEANGVTTMVVALPDGRYTDDFKIADFHARLQERVAAVPGVEAVSLTSRIPLEGKEGCTGVQTDQPSDGGRAEACVSTPQAAPGYFGTMRTHVAGREPTWDDVRQQSGAVVVTQALANVLWPGVNPVGRHVRCCESGAAWYTVVGVAEDVHDEGLDAPPMQAVYFPLVPINGAPIQQQALYMHVVIRAPGMNGEQLVPIVRRIATELDPSTPIANPEAMSAVVARSMAKRTFAMLLLAIAAAMALLLSTVGVYGVISYVVSQRGNEIGIRMALGATTSTVARLVLRQSLTYVMLGIGAGVITALAVTRALRSLLYGVSPTDPITLVTVSALLLLVGLGATLVPTRRATRVSPLDALREP